MKICFLILNFLLVSFPCIEPHFYCRNVLKFFETINLKLAHEFYSNVDRINNVIVGGTPNLHTQECYGIELQVIFILNSKLFRVLRLKTPRKSSFPK